MKILLISQDNSEHLNVGGKHIHQNQLIAAWRNQGHEVRTVFPRPRHITMPILSRVVFRLSRSWTSYSIRFFNNYLLRLKDELCQNFSQTMQEFTPDVISAQDPMAAVASAMALRKHRGPHPRITLTLHGYYAWEMINYGYYGEHNKPKIEEIGLELERQALTQVDTVISVDSRIREYLLAEHNFSGPIDVIFNAINIDPYRQKSDQEVLQLKQRHANQGEKIFLVARRLVLKNGVHVAISALARLLVKQKNIRLVIVGDGPEEANLRAQVKNLSIENYVDFIGSIDHDKVHLYYKAADIILMPSIPSDGIEEATSLSMLEGMAAGKIVVCSAIGGMKEIIKDRENGYLVNTNDPENLSAILEELLKSSPETLSSICEQARAFAFTHHDSENHSIKILSRMISN